MTDQWTDLEALAADATPGPWDQLTNHPTVWTRDGETVVAEAGPGVNRGQQIANAAFIAALNPSTALVLISAARASQVGIGPLADEPKAFPAPTEKGDGVVVVPKTLTMPNGEVLHCEYPRSTAWGDSWSIWYPERGSICTTGETGEEVVERYGLTAILTAMIAATQQATGEGEAPRGWWLGKGGDYAPTEAMVEAGLETNHRHNSEENLVRSFIAMMQQAEIDGLIAPPSALATQQATGEGDCEGCGGSSDTADNDGIPLCSACLSETARENEEPGFLGHLIVPNSGVGAVFIDKGESIPLMGGKGKVVPVYSGPQNVTATQQTVSPPEGVGWRPIETAPKNCPILIWTGAGVAMVAERYSPSSRTDDLLSTPGRWQQRATHWHALPPAPDASQDRPHRNAADGGSSNEGGE